MGRDADEELRGEKQPSALTYGQRLDFGELWRPRMGQIHTEVEVSADKKISIWRRDFLSKSLRTLQLLDSHPLTLSIGQRFDFDGKMKAGMEKVGEKGQGQNRGWDFSHQLSTTANV